MQTIKGRTINEKPMNLRALGQALKGKLAESLGLMRGQGHGQMEADTGRRGFLEITHLFLIGGRCGSSATIRGKDHDVMLFEFDDGRAFQIKLAKYQERNFKVEGEIWVGEISFDNLPSILSGRMLEGISYISSSGNGPQDVDMLNLVFGINSNLVIELVPGSLREMGFRGG